MNIAVDIGNSRLKCGVVPPYGEDVSFLGIPPQGERFGKDSLRRLFRKAETLTGGVHSVPLTWWIASTGSFPWQALKATILKVRPHDKFKIITRKQIPLKIDVNVPGKVGIDRLLAAFAAVQRYGDAPMLIVDAGSAITVDVVQNRTFRGGAILPGLMAQSEMYPKISEKLPHVPLHSITESVYPGKNTKDAIQNGIYWGTIGAIRQFYEMAFSSKENARLVLTGGDAEYLLPGLSKITHSRRIEYHDFLVLEGIYECVAK